LKRKGRKKGGGKGRKKQRRASWGGLGRRGGGERLQSAKILRNTASKEKKERGALSIFADCQEKKKEGERGEEDRQLPERPQKNFRRIKKRGEKVGGGRE